jgi:hypothetical protein
MAEDPLLADVSQRCRFDPLASLGHFAAAGRGFDPTSAVVVAEIGGLSREALWRCARQIYGPDLVEDYSNVTGQHLQSGRWLARLGPSRIAFGNSGGVQTGRSRVAGRNSVFDRADLAELLQWIDRDATGWAVVSLVGETKIVALPGDPDGFAASAHLTGGLTLNMVARYASPEIAEKGRVFVQSTVDLLGSDPRFATYAAEIRVTVDRQRVVATLSLDETQLRQLADLLVPLVRGLVHGPPSTKQ